MDEDDELEIVETVTFRVVSWRGFVALTLDHVADWLKEVAVYTAFCAKNANDKKAFHEEAALAIEQIASGDE